MRTHEQPVTHQSILQVLEQSECSFCRFLRKFQAVRLQNYAENDIRHLCNFHVWGLAAVQDALVAANLFLKLLEEPASISNGDTGCDICRKIRAEKNLRIREFVSCLARTEAVLCIPHGIKLRQRVPIVFTSRIDAIIESYRKKLAQESLQLSKKPELDRTGWESLGRTAEFLVAQRGSHE